MGLNVFEKSVQMFTKVTKKKWNVDHCQTQKQINKILQSQYQMHHFAEELVFWSKYLVNLFLTVKMDQISLVLFDTFENFCVICFQKQFGPVGQDFWFNFWRSWKNNSDFGPSLPEVIQSPTFANFHISPSRTRICAPFSAVSAEIGILENVCQTFVKRSKNKITNKFK